MSYPKIQFHADSMGGEMATLLSASTRLNCPVLNSAHGGDSIQVILSGPAFDPGVKQTGMGMYNFFRGGHQGELRTGQVQFILDVTKQIVACSPGKTMVLQQGINVQAAYKEAGFEKVSGWIDQITAAWASTYGAMYFPIRDKMIEQALATLPNLTAKDRQDMSLGLLPIIWRAPIGNSGHMSTEGKKVCADILAKHTRSLGTWPVGPLV